MVEDVRLLLVAEHDRGGLGLGCAVSCCWVDFL